MTEEHNAEGDASLLAVLAPYLAMTVVVAVMATLLVIRFAMPQLSAPLPEVVVFDVVKLTNAQRAVASRFLKQSEDQGAAGEILLNVSERTREVIQDVAGEGTLVMLKQAVVQGHERDITDEVLRRLGLPVEVPTADGVRYSLDVAPTMFLAVPPERNPASLGTGPGRSEGILP